MGGPDEQDGQPPGTVWMARRDERSTTARLAEFSGGPPKIVEATIAAALRWLDERAGGDA